MNESEIYVGFGDVDGCKWDYYYFTYFFILSYVTGVDFVWVLIVECLRRKEDWELKEYKNGIKQSYIDKSWLSWGGLCRGEFIEGKKFLAGESSSKLHMELEKDHRTKRYC